jgi:ATP-dependent RNA helicase DbpA
LDTAKFSDLDLKPEILRSILSLGYEKMTPVQNSSLPAILSNQDVTAQAKTGSGKTVAFACGLLEKIDVKKQAVQALVLCPTRELSQQVADEIRKLARFIPNLKVLTLCGGTPIAPQVASLDHGAHCIVGTPGRLEDHLQRRTLNLKAVSTLILDEADRMLEMGFSESIAGIVKKTPSSRQTLFFSATYPENIQTISRLYQKNSVNIKIDTKHKNFDIEQLFFKTTKNKKKTLLKILLTSYKLGSAVVFCNTKQKSQELANELEEDGFYAQAIHGDLDQRQRNEVLLLFANSSISVLVATDVAARGIDFKELEAVINFELPRDPEVYVHRIGRTGRAGKKGLALNLFSVEDMGKIKPIEEYQKSKAIVVDEKTLNKSHSKFRILPPMVTLCIGGGKKNKLRPTDILGALTTTGGLLGAEVGKINIFDFHSFVAIKKDKVEIAFKLLSEKKIKGRCFRIRKV